MANSEATNGISVDNLEARYRHLDREVGSLREDVAGHTATLNQMNTLLQDIAKTVNAPKRTEWQAMIAAATLVFGMAASYSTLSTRPIESDLQRVVNLQNEVISESNNYAQLVGNLQAKVGMQSKLIADSNAVHKELHQKIYELSQRVGYNEGRHDSITAKPAED